MFIHHLSDAKACFMLFSCAFVMPLFVDRDIFSEMRQKSKSRPRRREKLQSGVSKILDFSNTSLKDRPERPLKRYNNNLEVDFV